MIWLEQWELTRKYYYSLVVGTFHLTALKKNLGQ